MSRLWFTAAFVIFSGVGAAQSPFSCARVDTPGVARAEGLTELLPDIVVECTGGRTSTGAPPIYTVLLAVLGTWAVRPSFTPPASTTTTATTAAATPPWNEALLLIDDPAPAAQLVCLPVPTFTSCAPHTGANVFPARTLQSNLIGFTEIPLASPGDGKFRRFRVTNLRVNVPLSTVKTDAIATSIQLFDYLGNLISLAPRQSVSATAQSSYTLGLLDVNGNAVDPISPALLASPSVVPLNTPTPAVSFLAAFQEGFANAFRRRNVATTAANPTSVQSQNYPGLAYYTETGFFDIRLPLTTALSVAGSADSGTRLRLNFDNVPKNIIIWVSIRDTPVGTRFYSAANPKARLTYTNPNGDGPFSPVSPYIPGWAQLYTDSGKALAVWEVVSSDPQAIDQIAFSVALTSQGTAGAGAATIRGSIAPFIESAATAGATVTDTLTVVPHFLVPARPLAAFTLTDSITTSPASFTSAASFTGAVIAPGSLAAGFGVGLAPSSVSAVAPWPTTLGGLQVQIIDSTGVPQFAQLLFVSPQQVNFIVPEDTRTGAALINLIQQGVTVATGLTNVQSVAPGLFSADGTGSGAASGSAITLTSSGSNPPQPLSVQDSITGVWTPVPIVLSPDQPVYLLIYCTGIHYRSNLTAVSATLGGVAVPVLYAGVQSDLTGLDQINLGPLPASLQGRGEMDLVITVDGQEANRVRIAVQ